MQPRRGWSRFMPAAFPPRKKVVRRQEGASPDRIELRP